MHVLNDTLLDEYKTTLINNEKSIATIDKYMRDMKAFMTYVRRRHGKNADIDKEVVLNYKDYLGKNYKNSSANSMLAATNMFFKSNGWYECVVKPYKVQREAFRRSDRDLTLKEYNRLVKAAYARENIRLGLAMQTICCTGIRISELKFITVAAVKSGVAEICNKGKTRMVLLIPKLCDMLEKYADENCIQRGSIFVTRNGLPVDRSNLLHEMKDLCEAANVPKSKIFPHNLRHLFANTYYSKEKDLAHLADILGHSNINTTRIYTARSSYEQIKVIQSMGLLKQV